MASNRQAEYRNQYTPGESLPVFSTQLDSVRAYQFEVRFLGLPDQAAPGLAQKRDLTLAAKTVSPVGMNVEDIEVRRVNDKFYYPGYVNSDVVTITFDNLYLRQTASTLWNWFRTIYDPLSGNLTRIAEPGGPGGRTFKVNKMQIIELNNTRDPHAAVELYGVYPRSVKYSEKNYNTNEFATIEVEFRFDFMHYFNYN